MRNGSGAHDHTNLSASYHLAMLVLSLYAIAALAAEAAMRLDPQVRTVLAYADYAVCALFTCDFLISLWRARIACDISRRGAGSISSRPCPF